MKKQIIFLFSIIFCLLFCVGSYGKDEEIRFSSPAGFYEKEFNLTLSTDLSGATIFYTTDGTDPRTSASVKTYEGAIKISNGYAENLFYNNDLTSRTSSINGSQDPVSPMLRANVIRAYAKSKNGQTDVFTSSYFVDKNIKQAFGNLCVINLSLDRQYDFISQNGLYYNGNLQRRGKDWRKPAVCEIFESDGTRIINQYVTLSLNGHGSLGANQKSIRFHATDEVPGHEELLGTGPKMVEADLFLGDAKDIFGDTIDRFKCILLRNGGNDVSRTMLRDAFTHRIAKNTNVSVQAYRPVMLYINGEFWGLYNMRERYDDKYAETHFGVENEDVALITCPYPLDNPYNPRYQVEEGNPGDEDDFYIVYDFVQNEDMTKPESLAFVKQKFDTDSLIDYMCIEMFCRNADWPNNNVKLWRNKNPNTPSGTDTRWRMMLNDTDMGFYFDGRGYNDNMMTQTLSANRNTTIVSLFNGLLKNETFKQEFVDRFLYLLDNDFSAEVTIPILDQMTDGIEPVVDLLFARWPGDGGSRARWERELASVREFAQNRPEIMRRHLLQYFGMSDKSIVTVLNDSVCGTVLINSQTQTEYSKTYRNMTDKPMTITATPKDGFKFLGFSVKWADGEQDFYEGDTLSFDKMQGSSIACIYEDEKINTQNHIAAGYDAAFTLTDDGVLSFFGKNSYGQAGIESGDITAPMPITSRIVSVSSGGGHTLALTDTGTVYSAGDYASGRLCRDDTSLLFKQVSLKDITKVSAGFDHSLFLTKDGVLYGVGDNSYNQVSPGGEAAQKTPYQIAKNVRTMSAGRRHTLYVTNDNKLYHVGDSRYGKSGNGNLNLTKSAQPVFVADDVSECFGAFHNSFFIKKNGDLYGWGWNSHGSLGVGNADHQPTPVFVMGNVKSVSGHDGYTLILTNDGKLYGAGQNSHGQMGTMQSSTKPVFICDGVDEVCAGNGFSVIYTKDGRVKVMGSALELTEKDYELGEIFIKKDDITIIKQEKTDNFLNLEIKNNTNEEICVIIVVSEYENAQLCATSAESVKILPGEKQKIKQTLTENSVYQMYYNRDGLHKLN